MKTLFGIMASRHLLVALFFICSNFVYAREGNNPAPVINKPINNQSTRRINFYIITMDLKHKLDPFGFSVRLRAGIRSAFSSQKLYVITAENAASVAEKVVAILNREQAKVGTLWLDSHGLYRSCISSVNIGSDVFSYRNINDSAATAPLRQIAAFCDSGSSIGIGSCYGGATFIKPATDTTPAVKMNGDSLMIGMGRIFYGSMIYGSESWVMVKPGMFADKFGLAGYPLGKRYKNEGWKPVWERLGDWNRYNAATGEFVPVNTVGLNARGSIKIRMRHYQELSKGKNAVRRNIVKL